MNKGVEILLERIKTNPEEFMFDDEKPFADSRWRKIISHYKPYLDEEDIKALDAEINKHIQEAFTSAVMEELLDPKEEPQLTLNPSSITTTHRSMPSAGVTLGGSSGSTLVYNGANKQVWTAPSVSTSKQSVLKKLLQMRKTKP